MFGRFADFGNFGLLWADLGRFGPLRVDFGRFLPFPPQEAPRASRRPERSEAPHENIVIGSDFLQKFKDI